jgi:hypothetical protein
MKASGMGDCVVCEVSSVEQLLGDIVRRGPKLRLDADPERRIWSYKNDGLRCVQLCVEVAFALSDSSHLTALELFDLPPPLVMATATAIARNATKKKQITSGNLFAESWGD